MSYDIELPIENRELLDAMQNLVEQTSKAETKRVEEWVKECVKPLCPESVYREIEGKGLEANNYAKSYVANRGQIVHLHNGDMQFKWKGEIVGATLKAFKL